VNVFARILVSMTLMIIVQIVPANARPLVSFDGVGPVSIGMSVKAIERALGAKLDPVDKLVFSEDCYIAGRFDKLDPGIQYTIRDGRLTRIDVWQLRDVTVPPDAATSEGIGINSAEADVKRIYGKQLAITRAPYSDEESEAAAAEVRKRLGDTAADTPPEYWLQLDGPKDGRGIVFNTQDGKVTGIRIGQHHDINALEICQ
jgi:hypothetical protein